MKNNWVVVAVFHGHVFRFQTTEACARSTVETYKNYLAHTTPEKTALVGEKVVVRLDQLVALEIGPLENDPSHQAHKAQMEIYRLQAEAMKKHNKESREDWKGGDDY